MIDVERSPSKHMMIPISHFVEAPINGSEMTLMCDLPDQFESGMSKTSADVSSISANGGHDEGS